MRSEFWTKFLWSLFLVLWNVTAVHGQTPADSSAPSSVTPGENLLDLLNDLEAEENKPEGSSGNPKKIKKEKVYNTFSGTHIINGQSTETINKKTMAFIIAHRFGAVNSGWRDLFGLDQASMRMTFEYGILDNLTIGASRSTFAKTYDVYAKYRFADQRKKGMPLSMAAYANMAISSAKWTDPARPNYFPSRMSYAFQLMVARKFGEYFSIQVSPTVTHYNLVPTSDDPNTVFAIGVGAKLRLSKRMSFLAEYYGRIKDNKSNGYKDVYAFGLDIATGGHVFQFQFTNAQAMFESGFIRRTTGNFWKGDIHFGFNISRTWGVGKEAKAARIEKKAKKKALKQAAG